MEAVMEEVAAHKVAFRELDEFVREMKAKYPRHRLSFGYIGNDGLYQRDDRSFRVFTKYTQSMGASESYVLGSYTALRFDESIRMRITQWIESLDRKVAKGLLYAQ